MLLLSLHRSVTKTSHIHYTCYANSIWFMKSQKKMELFRAYQLYLDVKREESKIVLFRTFPLFFYIILSIYSIFLLYFYKHPLISQDEKNDKMSRDDENHWGGWGEIFFIKNSNQIDFFLLPPSEHTKVILY